MKTVAESGAEKVILPFERTDEIYEVEKITYLPPKPVYEQLILSHLLSALLFF